MKFKKRIIKIINIELIRLGKHYNKEKINSDLSKNY